MVIGNAGYCVEQLKIMQNMSLRKINTINLSKTVLTRLSSMGYENCKEGNSCSYEQLIFPMKIQKKGDKYVDRISEQELRLLFIEEFKKAYGDLFYSIETPTKSKYSFGKSYETIKQDSDGQSALIDMCVFERNSNEYQRILNIEFKNKNTANKNVGKDIIKLISENNDGVFIHLLQNTDRRTFCNKRETGVFDKFYNAFSDFQAKWEDKDKSIQLIIISLNQKTLLYRELKIDDLKNLKNIFFKESGCGNIEEIRGNGWETEKVK